jgi:hypothetical protein
MPKSEEENLKTDVTFFGFALHECVVEVDQNSVKYLRPIHRSALELSVHNRFGSEIGGFWLTPEQIDQLRKLANYYPASEAPFVANAIEAYLRAQLHELYFLSKTAEAQTAAPISKEILSG